MAAEQSKKGTWHIGIGMLAISLTVGILFGMSSFSVLKEFTEAAIHIDTLKLVGIIILVIFLGNLLKERGHLGKLMRSLEILIRLPRVSIIIPSAFIGLLPMPAGALLSAPMVDEPGDRMGLSPESKTFLNYWFRHVWEYSWPLYPGVIIASGVLDVSIREIIIHLFPLTLAAIASGAIFGLIKLPSNPSALPTQKQKSKRQYHGLRDFLVSTWPILAVILLVIIFKIEYIIALLIIIIVLVALGHLQSQKIGRALKRSLSLEMILLIVSLMIFKRILQSSGALASIPDFLGRMGISPLILLFGTPFLVGILTGMPVAFVGGTFPLLLPFMTGSELNFTYLMLAYVGGFSGYCFPLFICAFFLPRNTLEPISRKSTAFFFYRWVL
jgi:hypothetical protein